MALECTSRRLSGSRTDRCLSRGPRQAALPLHGWIELSLEPRDRWQRDSPGVGARDNGGRTAVRLRGNEKWPVDAVPICLCCAAAVGGLANRHRQTSRVCGAALKCTLMSMPYGTSGAPVRRRSARVFSRSCQSLLNWCAGSASEGAQHRIPRRGSTADPRWTNSWLGRRTLAVRKV